MSDVADLTPNAPDSASSSTPDIPGYGAITANIYTRNLTSGTTTLVSATPSGLASNGIAGSMAFSPDGSALAYVSSATDLTSNPLDPTPAPGGSTSVDNGPANQGNVFLTNLTTGVTTLVSATPGGMLSDGYVNQLVFSPDGHSLAYISSASDLTDNMVDVSPAVTTSVVSPSMLVDVSPTSTTSAVTPSMPVGVSPAVTTSVVSPSMAVDVSPTMTTTAVTPSMPVDSASTPDPWSSAGFENVFVYDLATQATKLVSATTSGRLSDGTAYGLIYSPDSQSLFYGSSATNLTSNPPSSSATDAYGGYNYQNNLFMTDLATGQTSLISATPGGQLSQSSMPNAVLSPDGQTLYFDSDDGQLDSNSGDSQPDGGQPGGVTELYAASAPFETPNQLTFGTWQIAADESAGQATITVVRNGSAGSTASVDYSVQNGTAQAGTDFQAISGTLDFAAGQSSATFSVPLIAADQFDGTRSATLLLSNPQGATLGYPTASLNLTSSLTTPAPTPTPTPVPNLAPSNSAAAPANAAPTTAAATPTPTVTPTPTPTSTSAPKSVAQPAGPTVTSVTPVKGKRGVTKLVIQFNQPLDQASAANVANYSLTVPRHSIRVFGRNRTAVASQRSVAIRAAAYDATHQQVTLTLHATFHKKQAAQLQINSGAGGIASTQGAALNSTGALKAGKDYLAELDLATRPA